MNQPSENIPRDGNVKSRDSRITNSPLTNLFARLKKGERDRKHSKGAFGGKTRAKRHNLS